MIIIIYKYKTRNLNNNHGITNRIYMKNKLLIIPGYLVGIGSLIILTYRTLLAFFSDSKSVTVYVNRYGEQYADVAILIFIWIVCLVGLRYLYLIIKEEKTSTAFGINILGKKVVNKDGLYLGVLKDSLIDKKTGVLNSVLVEPSDEFDSKLYDVDDDGNMIVSFDSIKLEKDDVIIR